MPTFRVNIYPLLKKYKSLTKHFFRKKPTDTQKPTYNFYTLKTAESTSTSLFFLFWDRRRLDCTNSNHWSGILLHCGPEHKANHSLETNVCHRISWEMRWKILFNSFSWRMQRHWTRDFNFLFVSCWYLRKCIVSKRTSL